MIIKALSLHEPWASMIADGEKTIETRMWATSYRGLLAICATKVPKFPRSGQIVAIAWLENVRPMTAADEKAACCGCDPGRFSWVLRSVRAVPAGWIVSGQQGLFDLDLQGPAVSIAEEIAALTVT